MNLKIYRKTGQIIRLSSFRLMFSFLIRFFFSASASVDGDLGIGRTVYSI